MFFRPHYESMESPSSASSSLLSYDRTSLKFENFPNSSFSEKNQEIYSFSFSEKVGDKTSDSVSVSSAPGMFVKLYQRIAILTISKLYNIL